MADPLSQLRQFHINGREIKEHSGYIIFGDHGWPKDVNTNYQIYSTDEEKAKKEYYTLECLLYFLKNMDVAHHHYVKQAGSYNIPVVHRPDRKNLLAYLKGEQQTSSGIDKNAPIPALRVPVSDIYKKEHSSNNNSSNSNAHQTHHHSSGDPQPSTSGSSHDNRHDVKNEAGTNSTPKKRPHDPEMEKKFREEFAARLYEPSNKKLASIMPQDSAEKGGETAEGSAAISKFGAEKLAAMRAKHLAVKRTTIIDADMDVGKSGLGTTSSGSKEAELLIAMDSDHSRLIRSKEKIWRTRSSILQAQSKNFHKTVMPMLALLTKIDDPGRKNIPSQMPPVQNDAQMGMYNQQPTQHQSQQQTVQRNAYNRYDQERFVKLDIGVEIDTKKSFVSGVANGLSIGSQSSQAASAVNRASTTDIAKQRMHSSAGTPRSTNDPKTSDPRSRPSSQVIPHRPTKPRSVVPIIIIPATTTSLINMYNASAILQDLNYVDGVASGRARESEILIHRKRPDGTNAPYKILDNPVKLDPEDWQRVVGVFVQGPAWQFKGWPWGGSPVEIFSRIKGFHLKWDESRLDDNVAKWNVHILELSRNKRHLDKANLLKFWSSLDNARPMARH